MTSPPAPVELKQCVFNYVMVDMEEKSALIYFALTSYSAQCFFSDRLFWRSKIPPVLGFCLDHRSLDQCIDYSSTPCLLNATEKNWKKSHNYSLG